MVTTLPITKAREDLTNIVTNAKKRLNEYVITVNGSPAAVIISAAEYDAWKETNEILDNSGLMQAIKKGEKESETDDYVTLDELKHQLEL